MSEFPWDHTDRFWGRGLLVTCSPEDARSMITALTDALDEVSGHALDGGRADGDGWSAWRAAVDAGRDGGAAPGLSVSVINQADAPLEVTADMDRHAQIRDVVAAAVADYDPSLHDADAERLRSIDRDRIRAAITAADVPAEQIAGVYRQAMDAADATRNHRWVDAGFQYEAHRQRTAQRDHARDDLPLGLAAEDRGRDSGRGRSL